jgi:hypothetical protein
MCCNDGTAYTALYSAIYSVQVSDQMMRRGLVLFLIVTTASKIFGAPDADTSVKDQMCKDENGEINSDSVNCVKIT